MLRRLSSPASASTPASTAAEPSAAPETAAASETTTAAEPSAASESAKTAAAAVESTAAAIESTCAQTGEAPIAVDARVRSVEASGSAAERIPIPAAAPRKIPVADAVGSSSASWIGCAGAAACPHSSGPIGEARAARAAGARSAGQVPALARDLLARGGLALCERIAASVTAKPVRRGPVAIGYAAAMSGIMSPIAQAIRWKL